MRSHNLTRAVLVAGVVSVLPVGGPADAKTAPKKAPLGLQAKGVVVDGRTGQVRSRGRAIGKLSLPPPPRRLKIARPTVKGRRLLHVVVTGGGGRRGELLAEPAASRVIFSGATGPQGVDGEWSLHLRVEGGSVLRYQRREGIDRCDGAPIYLFPRLYDFSAGRFRAASATARPSGLTELMATRRRPQDAPAGPPLALFRLTASSTQAGDEQRAGNLGPPDRAEDGDPATAWSESLGSDGRGEFLTARAPRSPHRLRAMAIVPGDATDAKRFRQANRLKTARLVLSLTRSYRIRFARDPLRDRGAPGDPYWVVLPEPVETQCATLVIEEVYRGARPGPGQGRTAIAELRYYTELDFAPGGGLAQAMRDLASDDPLRHGSAITVLGRLGPAGVDRALQTLPGAKPGPLLRRVVEVLARTPLPRSAAPLARNLARMSAPTRALALRTLGRLGEQAVKALVPLLSERTVPLAAKAEVARLLGRLGGGRARDALVAAVGHGPVALRAAVVDGVGRLREAGAALQATLAAALTARPTRAADLALAAGTVGRRGSLTARREAAARLGQLLRGPSSRPATSQPATSRPTANGETFELHYRLIHAIGQLDPAGQLETLRQVLADRQEPVLRWLAAQQVRRVAGARATRLLVAALADRDPRTRATAATALTRRRALGLAKALARRLDRERWGFAGRAIAEALGRHCGPVGLAALRRAVSRGLAGIEERALISLSECRPSGLVRELLELTGNDRRRASLRQRAVSLLPVKRLSTSQRDELLSTFVALRRAALRNPDDEQVAASAAVVLGKIGDAAATRALSDALSLDASATVRAASARGLGLICAPASKRLLQQAARDGSALVGQAAKMALHRCRWR